VPQGALGRIWASPSPWATQCARPAPEMPVVPAPIGQSTGKVHTPNGAGSECHQFVLLGPGGTVGSVARQELERVALVARAVQSCHELRGEGLAGKCELLRRAGTGDEEAVHRLGLVLTAEEAAEAATALRADLALLELEDDPELAEPEREAGYAELVELPFSVAEALKWLAWHEAWLAALARANSGSRPLLVDENAARTGLPAAERMRPGVRQRLVEKARSAWTAACGGHPALGSCLAEAVGTAAGAAARHTAARGVFPKSLEVARAEWNTLADSLVAVEAEAALAEDLREQVKWLLWNASWHATNLVSQHQGEGDEDEEEEQVGEAEDDEEHAEMEDSELFGDEDYPGIDEDPLKNLAQFLLHAARLHRSPAFGDSGEPWRGLCLPANSKEESVQAAAMAGFNAVRLPVSISRGSTDEALKAVMPLLRECEKVGLQAVLDCLGCSMRGSQGQDALCRCLASVAAAASEPGGPAVHGVALPRLTSPQAALPLAEALRSGGLRPEACAIILQLEDTPLDEEGCFAGFLRRALCQGEQGLLLADGHIVFEVYRRLPEHAKGPPALLDAASRSGPEASLPLGCSRWGLAVPSSLTRKCQDLGERWREELASRWEAGSGESTHGWFAMLDDAAGRGAGRTVNAGTLQMCLTRRWRWPDPLADRVLWPHAMPHVATFVYLHGFTCDGSSYLPCHNYFRKEIIPVLGVNSEGEEEEELECDYDPYPGLKVILPSAPVRPITCYSGQQFRSWYDYRTDHKGEMEDELSLETLEEVVRRVHHTLDAEASLLGGPGRVLLGGASQGAAVALHSALTYPGHLGGVMATQGHLLSLTQLPADWAERGTPVRVYNGLADSTMPWGVWVSDTYDRLRQSGCDLEFVTEEDVDHGDDEAEGRWVRAFLQEMWVRLGLDA